jgi:hypothetical protein
MAASAQDDEILAPDVAARGTDLNILKIQTSNAAPTDAKVPFRCLFLRTLPIFHIMPMPVPVDFPSLCVRFCMHMVHMDFPSLCVRFFTWYTWIFLVFVLCFVCTRVHVRNAHMRYMPMPMNVHVHMQFPLLYVCMYTIHMCICICLAWQCPIHILVHAQFPSLCACVISFSVATDICFVQCILT